MHHFDRHQAAAPTDSGDPAAVISGSTGNPGSLSAMPVIIARVIIPIDKIPASYIVDIAIVVIILTIPGDLSGISPELTRQIRMGKVHA